MTENDHTKIDRRVKPVDVLEAFNNLPPTPDFILPGMISGTVGSIVAQGGAGKSWAALEIGIGVAGGPDLLEIGIPAHGPVVYLPAEDPELAIRHRLHAIGPHIDEEARRTVAQALTIWPMIGLQVDVMAQAWADAIERVADGSRLVILDTLRRFHIEDENLSGPMAQLLGVLEGICDRTSSSILFLHHTSKGAALNGAAGEQQASRGSSVLVDNIRGGLWNLIGMSEKEAEGFNLGGDDRRRFIRLTQSKANFGQLAEDKWLERGDGGILLPADIEEADRDEKKPPRKAPWERPHG